ncbi:HD-GYP domain-containing protein [Candidatus Galacturonibacter soehngenii]|uniref:HD domain-containing protein n=1 Tax=Candidatus Galacturonatibacter soehngenii TaxID=2307010 RepID=A0A7V7QLQ9_9FIRM|nr:HD domain-containing phosphohydrolase [Candidatus Galacturonibacter soehngenii]KAB1439343.1 HD domain-containing protein [Candidatus Galacturonibacter soehngenii]MBA4687534.1 HD domain-containing protein [Candidatus Galacturonibacter soehngenii]
MKKASIPLKKEEIINYDMYYNLVHGMCVSNLAYHIAKELHLKDEICYELAQAGMLHDIGKLRLSDYLYGRDENTLAIEEMKYIQMHSIYGYEILKKKGYSDFVSKAVLYHHENFDGSGYPDNLKESDIPIGARILRVCDVFAALISDRPYRSAFDVDVAVELMIEEVKNFDMEVFLAFMRVVNSENSLSLYDI